MNPYDSIVELVLTLFGKITFKPSSEEINILRNYRDVKLMPNPFLEKMVRLYYKTSPAIASIIARNDRMRGIIRFYLDLLIRKFHPADLFHAIERVRERVEKV